MGEPRIGLGFDVHPIEVGRPLLLGGVPIEDEPGLGGHSDADVVCHALADAMLGAAALGDLGEHFPDDDPAYEGIGGLKLLGLANDLVWRDGWRAVSCDLTVIAERPAIAPHRGTMRSNLAATLRIDPDRISVKATRPDGLGLRGDGIGCLALAVLAEL